VAEGFRVLGLIRNNIFLDKTYELSTYNLKIIDQLIENHDKRRDPRQEIHKSFVPKVVPQS
jgi:hypothetical protein